MTTFEDTTPFVLALLITFIVLVCVSMWNNFNTVKPEIQYTKPKNEGPSRTRELLVRFTKFYNDLEATSMYIFDTEILPDPKQHIIHALYVGYDESQSDEDKKAIKIGLEAVVQFQDLVGSETLKPDFEDQAFLGLDISTINIDEIDSMTYNEEQKKYIKFSQKRNAELEFHFAHLKIKQDEGPNKELQKDDVIINSDNNEEV